MEKPFGDRFFLIRLTKDEQKVRTAIILIAVLLIILLANTAYLTFLSLQKQPGASAEKSVSAAVSSSPTATVVPPTPTVPPSPTIVPIVNTQSNIKEIFIPFGSGTNQTSDWVDVPGLRAEIDFGKYKDIKEVHFEATVGIPTQNESASVQLFDETDAHPVWYSPITLTDGQFVSSNPIVWEAGPKVYQVQMKTSLNFLANLYMARLHIILK